VKFHGWVFIDDGARMASARISSISSRGTGSGLYPRMIERRPMMTVIEFHLYRAWAVEPGNRPRQPSIQAPFLRTLRRARLD
jgi:hypothetical protein